MKEIGKPEKEKEENKIKIEMDPGETFQPRIRNRPAAHLLFT
jgi:hypothetical protein